MPTTIATDTLKRLLNVQTNSDVEAILDTVDRPIWKPVGDKPNNHALINVLIEPGDALVERVTDAFDAVIERAVLKNKREDLQSPRQAADELLGVPGGHVYNLRGEDEVRRGLAKNVVVTVRDSGADKAPTISIEDRGVGQHPTAFERTLVSLAEENKLRRMYQIGAYGWGGAAVFSFTDRYAIFVSRRDPTLLEEGQADEVGWTIVRYDSRDDDPQSKHGVYEYLTIDEGGQAPVIPHTSVDSLPSTHRDWVGTNCTLVQYELPRYSDAVFRPSKSLWLLFNALLFDPPMPFLLRDERVKSIRANESSSLKGLVINGTAAKLVWDAEKPEKSRLISLRRSWQSRLPDGGTVVIKYYVVASKGDAKADFDPTQTYVTSEQAVTVTHNGQRQGSFRRELFEKMNLITLAKFLIVHVDCDGLSWKSKRELFSSTRDRLKDSAIARMVRDMVAEALESDPEVRALDRMRKEEALARRSVDQAERIRKLLEKHIAGLREGWEMAYKKVISSNTELPILGDQPLLDEATTTVRNPTETPEAGAIDFPDEPTALTVLNPTVEVRPGGKAVVRLALNAPDDYITTEGGRGKFTPIVTKGDDIFRVVGNSDLRRGLMRCTISASDKASPGDRGRVVFTIARPEALPLLGEAETVVVEPPQPRVKPAGKRQGPEVGPNVESITKDMWSTFNFDEKTVARVEKNSPKQGMTTVYVNFDYPPLEKRLMALKVPVDKLGAYKEKFTAAMALLAWLQDEQQDAEHVVEREVLDAELRRGAEIYLFAQTVD